MKALFVLLLMTIPAFGQNVNRTVIVEPGTVLTITQNGRMLMSHHVQPGKVHIQITYLRGR